MGQSAGWPRAQGIARWSIAVLIAAGLVMSAAAAQAETFVLVYAEGSVVALPGGVTVSKGEQIDGSKLVQLGPADKAIFISQSGNVVRHDGPFCGLVSQSQECESGATQPSGCQK